MKSAHPPRVAIRCLARILILTTTMLFTLQIGARAMLAPAQIAAQTTSSEQDRTQDMKTVQNALESKLLRQRLKEFGLTDKEVQSRLGKLSDKEVHQLAMQIHALSPGGDVDGGGIVIGLLLVVLLVLLIIYLAKRV